ncbi:MAG: ASKHA domain-containing protein [Candidatus Hydrogenedentota bacterium]
MESTSVTVRFSPQGRTVHVLSGSSVIEASARAGLPLETPCGGTGSCGKCGVQFTQGAPAPSASDHAHFDAAALADGWRLACQAHVTESAVVALPERSVFGSDHQILVHADVHGYGDDMLRLAVVKRHVTLVPPALGDDRPDVTRLEEVVGPVRYDLPLLRVLSQRLRANGFAGTAVLSDGQLVDFEPGDTAGACYGAAFDIGTTTLVCSLIDLRTGAELSVVSRMNPQVRYGDDVLARIQHGSDAPGREMLHAVIIEAVNAMLDGVCGEADTAREQVYQLSFSGNTTMEHLLCGLDPAPLGRVPFTPAFARGQTFAAASLGVHVHPGAAAYVLPVVGGFVGGDTVAGILISDLNTAGAPVLLIDIGTNGELVLAHEGKLWAASTAAGPAFEGARIASGMRATRGAIEKVVIEDDVVCDVIGGGDALGLCGSGLIDCAAELLRHGIITQNGRLLPPGELPEHLPPALRDRVSAAADTGDTAFLLAAAPGAGAVVLTQRDVRELQLATGAIRGGINVLLEIAGVQATDIAEVRIAGGFGSFIRRRNAQRIGLLPPGVPRERIRYVGNASLSGARWALLCRDARARAEAIARTCTHVELSRHPEFDMAFAMAMVFPEA